MSPILANSQPDERIKKIESEIVRSENEIRSLENKVPLDLEEEDYVDVLKKYLEKLRELQQKLTEKQK